MSCYNAFFPTAYIRCLLFFLFWVDIILDLQNITTLILLLSTSIFRYNNIQTKQVMKKYDESNCIQTFETSQRFIQPFITCQIHQISLFANIQPPKFIQEKPFDWVHVCSATSYLVIYEYRKSFVNELYYVDKTNYSMYKHKLRLKMKNYKLVIFKQKFVIIFINSEEYDKKGKIIVWDLSDGEFQISDSEHTLANSNTVLYLFQDSNILSVCERDKNFKITSYLIYFEKKMVKTNIKNVPSLRKMDEFEQSLKDLMPIRNLRDLYIFKIDNKSKIAIIDNSPKQNCLEFTVYHVTDRAKYSYQKPPIIEKFIFENRLVDVERYQRIQISKLWEIQPGVLYLKLNILLNQGVYINDPFAQQHADFIWHYKKGTVRLPTYAKDPEILKQPFYEIQFVNSLSQISCLTPIMTFSSFNAFDEINQSPLFLVEHTITDGQKIIAKIDLNRCMNHQYVILENNNINFREFFPQNSNTVSILRIWVKGYGKDAKSTTAFFMTEIVKNVDDDLLDYVVSMISHDRDQTRQY